MLCEFLMVVFRDVSDAKIGWGRKKGFFRPLDAGNGLGFLFHVIASLFFFFLYRKQI